MRIANLISDSIVDGPGLRFTVFVQGCPHACPGCHNPDTHGRGGQDIPVADLADRMLHNPLLGGLTLSGGEPFLQPEDCVALAQCAHHRGLDVWTYTGYTYEFLLEEADPERLKLLEESDVLVDGPFLQQQKSYTALFRGSSNQRLIDLKASHRTGQVVQWTRTDHLSQFMVPES